MEKIHVYIITTIGSVVAGLCVYIWTRTISEYDKMIGNLFDKQDEHETRLSTLEGEHNVNACKVKQKKRVRKVRRKET